MIMGSILQKDITILSVYEQRVKIHETKTDRKQRAIDKSSIIAEDFNAPLSKVNRPTGRKSEAYS